MTFKKEPVWISINVLGKYEGISWRFTYREYNNPAADDVIKSFVFQWPGIIPDDKAYAEKGIKALFLNSLESDGFSYKVIKEEEPSHIDDLDQVIDKLESDYDDDL